MKVKTFVAGVADGLDGAFEFLDHMVEALGSINIHSINDTVYPDELNTQGPCPGSRVVRVVIFTPIKAK